MTHTVVASSNANSRGPQGWRVTVLRLGCSRSGSAIADVLVHGVDVVGLDRHLGPVLRGELRVLYEVDLGVVASEHGQSVVAVQDGHADTAGEQVEPDADVGVRHSQKTRPE